MKKMAKGKCGEEEERRKKKTQLRSMTKEVKENKRLVEEEGEDRT